MKQRNKFAILIFLSFFGVFGYSSATEQVTVYLFHLETCPHCVAERQFLQKLREEMPQITITELEVSDPVNLKIMQEAGKKLSFDISGVPVTVIGNKTILGFDTEEITGKSIKEAVNECADTTCEDFIKPIIEGQKAGGNGTKGSTVIISIVTALLASAVIVLYAVKPSWLGIKK